jgi:hypothetical protein
MIEKPQDTTLPCDLSALAHIPGAFCTQLPSAVHLLAIRLPSGKAAPDSRQGHAVVFLPRPRGERSGVATAGREVSFIEQIGGARTQTLPSSTFGLSERRRPAGRSYLAPLSLK